MLSIAMNRAEHVCTTVITKHDEMLLCNHNIVINVMLCLLINSTEHYKSRTIVELPTCDDTRNRSISKQQLTS